MPQRRFFPSRRESGSTATLLLVALVCAFASPLAGQSPAGPQAPVPVTLLVVVDQLRPDLLDRYDDLFTGGFRTLRDEGYRFTQATHDHALTFTAPGHATLSTGTHPSRHGIVANVWFENGEIVENVVDQGTSALGAAGRPGMGLAPLLRSTVGEWLGATHPDARILSVSGKSRAAALMAGRAEASVVWFDAEAGGFLTSGPWATELPAWIATFNDEALPGLVAERSWELRVPEQALDRARADAAPWEDDGVHTTFPHDFEEVAELWAGDAVGWWATTPYLDRATRLITQAGIEGMGIGEDAVPDLVMLSLSQTDRIGHAYGPHSLEQLDNLLRLDAELGELFTFLTDRFGPEGWRLVLTADHGVADTPEHALAAGRAGLRIGTDSAVAFQEVLNEAALKVADPAAMPGALAEAAPTVSWVEQAWTFEELTSPPMAAAPDSFTTLHARSSFPGRTTGVLGRQGVELRFSEGTLLWTVPTGTTHGSPYMYDRHVPLVFFGSGIPAGVDETPVGAVDVAPTLSSLLGAGMPDDLDGVVRPIG